MPDRISQQEINDTLWRACDTFRGTLDPAQYKDYLLVMLFLKYVSDVWTDKQEELQERYKGDNVRVERALGRERFVVPPESHFKYLYDRRDAPNIGELINISLEQIEDANRAKLENVFRNIDFNSEPYLGETKDRNRRLKNLLQDFANPVLDLRPSRIGTLDVIGNAYEYLIGHFASDAGKKGGEFYTPAEVATLLAKLLEPKKGETMVVSAAAGATGSIVGQIGKIRGCRVVGIAGTDDKCNWLSKDLGFDAAINYKHRDWKGKLAAAVPDGIDIDFENVGGEIMQTVLGLMNLHGRVVVCGLISGYNKQDPGMMSLGTVILKRLRVEGFLLLDYVSRFMEAATQLGQWKMFGKIKDRETIVEGLEKTPDAINMLFTGANTGKLIVKI